MLLPPFELERWFVEYRIGFGRDEQGFGTGLAALGRYLDYLSK